MQKRAYSAREREAFNLTSLFDQAATATRGYELELLEDAALRDGRSFNPRRPVVPWELLTRDLSATGSDTGAYLVEAGLTVIDGLRSNITIPRVTTAATPQWLASELDALTPSQPTLGDVSMTPKICGALTTYTKQLAAQQGRLEAFLRTHLLKTVGKAVDQAVIAGSGVSGQPQGIVGSAGVDTESGTSLGWSGLTAMQKAVAEAGSEPSALVTTPAVRALLQAREVATGAGLVWNGSRVGSLPAYATAACPTASLVVADFAQALLGIWGSGPEIAIDAYTGWSTGAVSIRVMLACDTALLHPASFSVSTSIT